MKEIKEKNKSSHLKWYIEVLVITFILSILFSYISANGVSNLSLVPAILILIFVIAVGIIFDMIGVAVTVADENEFHAKATKKIEGSKTSIRLIKNASKVANFCADIIGDICGVLSGAIGTLIALRIIQTLNVNSNIQYFISAISASIMIVGKAIGKDIAMKNATPIVHRVGKIVNKFSGKDK